MTEMTVSETLNRAADLIEERGWATGNCGMVAAPDAPMCLEGALAAALEIQPVASLGTRGIVPGTPVYPYGHALQRSAAYAAVVAHLEFDLDLWLWNDTRATEGGVVEALRACAVIEASRERQPAQVSS